MWFTRNKTSPTLFVVVSMPRSGTHMLRTLLNQHPEIRTAEELFNEASSACKKWEHRSAEWVLEAEPGEKVRNPFVVFWHTSASASAGESGSICNR